MKKLYVVSIEVVVKIENGVHLNELVVYDCEPADILDWLVETFGPVRPKNPSWTYWAGVSCIGITFSDPKHKEWFLLRWA